MYQVGRDRGEIAVRSMAAFVLLALLLGVIPSTHALLQVLTFDLDDTLFPCGAVVARANAVLLERLLSCGVDIQSASEIQTRMRAIREKSSTALTYSGLRTQAIASLLGESSSAASRTVSAEQLFSSWLGERQDAANDLLYAGAEDAVRACSQAYPDAIIGAVSNGRGDPMEMSRLASHFDFTVSGEDADVFPERKPSPIIYEHALRRAASVRAARGLADAGALAQNWVHVGDCLVNDVSASKLAGARTVWLDLSAAEEAPKDATAEFVLAGAGFSTASAEEVARRREAADEALRSGRVDVRIRSIVELPAALAELAELARG